MKKIVVWHEVPLLAEGLCLVLKAHFPDYRVHVVARWSDRHLAVSRAQNVLVICGDQPVLQGVNKLSLVRKAHPDMPCVFLTRLHPEAVQRMVKVEPWDVVLDSGLPVSQLMQALGDWLAQPKPGRVAEPVPESLPVSEPPGGLASTSSDVASKFKMTRRYQEIVLLAMQGYTNAKIAQVLGVSEQTVKVHSWRMYQALGVKSRMQAIHKLRMLGYLGGLQAEGLEPLPREDADDAVED